MSQSVALDGGCARADVAIAARGCARQGVPGRAIIAATVVHSLVQVVAAVIERDGRVLLGRRSPHKRSAPGCWCPVTGRVEEGESQPEAVAREVLEEVGMAVVAERSLGAWRTRDGSAVIHWWGVRILGGDATLRNDEHTLLGWFDRAELTALEPMFPEDRAILLALIDGA